MVTMNERTGARSAATSELKPVTQSDRGGCVYCLCCLFMLILFKLLLRMAMACTLSLCSAVCFLNVIYYGEW